DFMAAMLRYGGLLATVLVAVLFIAQEGAVSCDRAGRVLARAKSRRVWKTLTGQEPLVIARGGLSGLFPDYTSYAYQVAMNNSLPNVVLFCDLQLTQDGGSICRTDLNLENSTNIADIFKDRKSTYMVNGKQVTGWFSIDFTAEEILSKVLAKQSVLSRSYKFDGLPVLPVEGVDSLSPPALWINVQYSKFYEEHKLSMIQYVLSTAKQISYEYISSPEVEFLKRIRSGLRKSTSKLVLRFLGKEDIEPSTNQTYGTLLNNLTFVKNYAFGILVPKDYIWPLENGFVKTPTSLVQDAHKAGLEVYASDFANDEFAMSYNYSYDPVREYLQFVDNSDFAVDGVLTDFSVTASEAIACYAHKKKNISSNSGKPLIISYNGASGDFPGCTDLAYQGAIKDGADYIDCSVQMTKDGVAICRESPDLMGSTNVASVSSIFPSRLMQVADIQKEKGIFTFDFMWKEIQGLKPQIFSPFALNYGMARNPANMNKGQFMSLSDFLELAKGQANVGVLVNIQKARYLASNRSLDVINATLTALEKAGYGNMTDRVMIQSEDSAVLRKFRQKAAYKLVYQIDESDVSVPNATIKEIKGFADAVTLSRSVVFPTSDFFLMSTINIVNQMHLDNLTVFAFRLRNEFPTLAFDYLSDPTMEINTFVNVAKLDGLFTEFPATANAYLNNACRQHRKNTEYSMFLVEPGALLSAMPPSVLPPPALAPAFTDVIDPPLPSISVVALTPAPSVSQPSTSINNGQPSTFCHFSLLLVFSFFILALLNRN
ncbi:hypothetical protein KI387_015544, partial [Taxus chinensis]